MQANLTDYQAEYAAFNWQEVENRIIESNKPEASNIAYLAVDKHANGKLKDVIALRFIRKDKSVLNLTYNDLKKRTSKFANVLHSLGIEQGDRVFTLAGRIPELYIAALGVLKYKAIYCPLFSVYGPEPIFQRLSKGKAKVLVTTTALYEKKVKDQHEKLPSMQYVLLTDSAVHISKNILSLTLLMEEASDDFTILETHLETPALLHFTSGTTGMPKGVLHIHKAVLTHYVTGKFVLDFHEGDVFWCTADPGWVTGTSYGIIAPLVNGVTSIIDEEEFDASCWYSILEEQKVTIWYTSPTAIRRLMRVDILPREKYQLDNLRLILSVGEPLQAGEVNWGTKVFGMPILDNWWQSETGGIMIANYRAMTVKPGSMGKPLPGIEAAIGEMIDGKITVIDEPDKQGQLILKTGFPSQFQTYIDEDERYKKCFSGEWYITGDLAKKDSDGYFWFVGRADDIIKTSGHMVGPFEVESTLMKHPAVSEAAVIGKPEPSIGELVKAFIVLRAGFEANDETMTSILAFARKEMGPAVAPKEIAFIDSIPKTKSGKILRRLLKAREMGQPEGDLSTLETLPTS